MISKIKTLATASVEVPILRAKAMGMGYIESRIAQNIGSPAIAKAITEAFGLKGISKEEQKTAKKILKEKYGVDPRLESMFGPGGGFADDDDGVGSKPILKRLNEIKKTLISMAKDVVSISGKLDNILNQNDKILKSAQSRLAEEIGQIMQAAPMPMAQPDLPVGTEMSQGGIIIPQTKEKLFERTIFEKESKPGAPDLEPKPSEPAESVASQEEPKEKKEADAAEQPTAIPAKQNKIVQLIIDKSINRIINKSPLLKLLFKKDKPQKAASATSTPEKEEPTLSEFKGSPSTSNDPESLQPVFEGIAEKKPIQSQIEPDELQELLKKALKDAMLELKNEDPDLFKGGSGGIIETLGSLGGLMRGGVKGVVGGATKKAAAKGTAKVFGKSLLKSTLKKIPIVGAIAGLGFAASRAMAGDWTGAAMEAGSGLAGTVPGVGTAASVGIDAALAARDAGVLGGGSPVPPKPAEPQLSTIIPTNAGAEIIEMNRRINSGEVAVQTAPQKAPIVQRIVNNVVAPPSEKKQNIDVNNKENTFNRLIAQDYDHPAAYSNFNMG